MTVSSSDRNDRLKIAYLCDFSPLDPNLYSGGNARLFQALCAHAGDVHILSNDWGMAEPMRRLVQKMPENLYIRLRWRMHLAMAPLIARRVRAELAQRRYDVLFGAYSFHSMFRVRPPYPMVTAYTSDATPTVYKNSVVGEAFGSYFTPSRLVDPLITRAEGATFRNIDLNLWPSEWLKSGADDLYGLRTDQSVLVPWGGNIERPDPDPSPPTLGPGAPVRLLFVGRNWREKGGETTFATFNALRDKGVDARLTIVGCTPPDRVEGPHVTVHRRLDKTNPEQLALFRDLYRSAHFLVMPSMESWGFVFCEASAYGLPSLCVAAGGIPVRNGVNGHAFPLGTPAETFAEHILRHMENPEGYAALRASARREYEQSLNWDAWGKRVGALLRERVARLQA